MNADGNNDKVSDFNRHVGRTGRCVVMLDYDGTVAPFSPDLGDVEPYEGVSACLDALQEADGARLVVVTGRFLKEAPPALGTRRRPEIWGSHGRERLLPDGSYAVTGIDPARLNALTVADTWSPLVEDAGGRCEAKPGSIAFHWRGADPGQMAKIRRIVTEGFHRDGLVGVLDLHSFDGGLELRAPGPGKGDVVRAILGETAGDVPVAYLGDDLTDEDAFAALKGRGLAVLVRPEHRSTGADVWIRPPDELIALLSHWARLAGHA